MKFWTSFVLFMCLICFDCFAFLCIRTSSKSLRECLRAGRFRPPHYCTPLVCVSKFSKGFAVWRPTQPKPQPETRDFVYTGSHVEKVLRSVWDPVYTGSHVEKDPVYTGRPCVHMLRSVWDPVYTGSLLRKCWEVFRVFLCTQGLMTRKTLCTQEDPMYSCWEACETLCTQGLMLRKCWEVYETLCTQGLVTR